jgi:hypothetical protein
LPHRYGRMARGGHGLPKVSPRSAMPNPSKPCGHAGRPPMKRSYSCLRGGPPSGRGACGCLLPLWKPHAVLFSCFVELKISSSITIELHRKLKIRIEMFYSLYEVLIFSNQACMGRGIHRLPKVSPGPTMPNRSIQCGQATPKTALWPFRE